MCRAGLDCLLMRLPSTFAGSVSTFRQPGGANGRILAVAQRREAMLVDDDGDGYSGGYLDDGYDGGGYPPDRPTRSRRRRAEPQPRELNPITVALVVGGVLAVIGISLAVVAPMASGSPKADTMPVGAVLADPSASGSAAASAAPTPSTLSSPLPNTPTATPGRFRADSLESDVIKLTNTARKQAGCKSLGNNSRLHTVARAHSTDMAAHNTTDTGGSYDTRAKQAGYRDPLGENVAHGPTTAAAVVQQWMSNGSTKSRMLDCQATAIGVGVAQAADGSLWWTADFGK